jgi:hypothetical protein
VSLILRRCRTSESVFVESNRAAQQNQNAEKISSAFSQIESVSRPSRNGRSVWRGKLNRGKGTSRRLAAAFLISHTDQTRPAADSVPQEHWTALRRLLFVSDSPRNAATPPDQFVALRPERHLWVEKCEMPSPHGCPIAAAELQRDPAPAEEKPCVCGLRLSGVYECRTRPDYHRRRTLVKRSRSGI